MKLPKTPYQPKVVYHIQFQVKEFPKQPIMIYGLTVDSAVKIAQIVKNLPNFLDGLIVASWRKSPRGRWMRKSELIS